MTPEDTLDFLLTHNFDFMFLDYEIDPNVKRNLQCFTLELEWKSKKLKDMDEKGRTFYKNIGEYKIKSRFLTFFENSSDNKNRFISKSIILCAIF